MKRNIIALLIAVVLVVSTPMVVLAISDPDTPPSVSAVYFYNDLLETGDGGVLIDYYLDYAATPTETATDAYLAAFIDTDNTTQLKSVAPYTYDTKGYGRGIVWLYFTAAEVTTYGIDSANIALYKIWFMGNPTLAWAGDPPKTEVGIDYWMPAGASAAYFLKLRVLSYADILSTAWTEDLLQVTPSGDRLSDTGEAYFMNAIPNLRTMAPDAFADSTTNPNYDPVDYTTEFGATMTDTTGTVVGSPITLVEGTNNVNITGVGTFEFDLTKGTEGTVTTDVGVITGSPVTIRYGTSNVTATGIGNVVVVVNLVNTQSAITDTITGTGFDLSDPATAFGMSTMMFSGLVWLLVTVIICAGVYRGLNKDGSRSSGGKVVLLVFDICIIGGTVLGFLPVRVSVLLFIGFGAFTGYALFYKHSSI